MERLILATNNKMKVREIKEILKDFYEIVSLKEAGIEIEVEEDKDTFEGNAIKKATTIAKLTGKACLADDSGLCIDVLDGFPGVKTARFLGENATQSERNSYLISKLEGMPKERRKAHSITYIALVRPNGEQKVFKGILDGYITTEKRGKNGDGYDEIFEIESGKTLAELEAYEKNEISNRRMALDKLKEDLKEEF